MPLTAVLLLVGADDQRDHEQYCQPLRVERMPSQSAQVSSHPLLQCSHCRHLPSSPTLALLSLPATLCRADAQTMLMPEQGRDTLTPLAYQPNQDIAHDERHLPPRGWSERGVYAVQGSKPVWGVREGKRVRVRACELLQTQGFLLLAWLARVGPPSSSAPTPFTAVNTVVAALISRPCQAEVRAPAPQ